MTSRSDTLKPIIDASSKLIAGPFQLWRGTEIWENKTDGHTTLEVRRDLSKVSQIEFQGISFLGWPNRNILEWEATNDHDINAEIRRLINRGPVLHLGGEQIKVSEMTPGQTYVLSTEEKEISVNISWGGEEYWVRATRREMRNQIAFESKLKFIIVLDEKGQERSPFTLNPDQKYTLVTEIVPDENTTCTVSWGGDCWPVDLSHPSRVLPQILGKVDDRVAPWDGTRKLDFSQLRPGRSYELKPIPKPLNRARVTSSFVCLSP
jgi:hypothetical protein